MNSIITIQENVDLQGFNTLGVPSCARYFVKVSNENEIRQAIEWSKEHSLPLVILGGGSNILLDENIKALVVHIALLGKATLRETSLSEPILDKDSERKILRACAGENWHEWVNYCAEQQAYGLENLALIPGTVGAAAVQNIGAYGVEVASTIECVRVLNIMTLEVSDLSAEECLFSYRESIFKTPAGLPFIILSIDFSLSKFFKPNLNYPALANRVKQKDVNAESVIQAVVSIRREKLPDPSIDANVGSFFKNPIVSLQKLETLRCHFPEIASFPYNEKAKIAAAWLIDNAGWKGKIHGGVSVHESQALVIVNRKLAGLSDVLAFAHAIQSDIAQRYDIELEIEPQAPRLIYATKPVFE
ncbi:MAG: UDP-N-acetylmuramate dehydrogenase [Flavobacteriales bacterium]|jgi:UDP-N-acetylmuramate dehydrogenase